MSVTATELFKLNKHQLRELVQIGNPDECNAARREIERRATNKSIKRAVRAQIEASVGNDLIEQEREDHLVSEEAMESVREPIAE